MRRAEMGVYDLEGGKPYMSHSRAVAVKRWNNLQGRVRLSLAPVMSRDVLAEFDAEMERRFLWQWIAVWPSEEGPVHAVTCPGVQL